MKNKKLILGISTIAIISLIVTGCGKKIELKDGAQVAVSVKGTKFTATEYYEKIKEDNITTLIDMIDQALLNEKYPKDEDEDKAVEGQIKQIKEYYGDDAETYKTFLLQYFGVETEEDLEKMLRLEYKRNQAVTDYISKNLTEKEIKKYYEENVYPETEASHILISVDIEKDATTDEKEEAYKVAEKKAKEIIEKLEKGEDFAELAKKYSNDESNNEKGGELGYFDPNEMVEEFKDALVKLKVDEYTKEPVKTQFGYHIILKTGEKEKKELKDLESEIKETLAEQKISDDNSVYYESLLKYRKENGLSWNDTTLEKSYNDYMDNLIKKSKENN